MEEVIAIDVVFLLPEHIVKICQDVNNCLDNTDYVSFKEGYNPHVTLGMGSLKISDIDNFTKDLEATLQKLTAPHILLESLETEKYCGFTVGMNTVLKDYHVTVFDLISKYSAGAVSYQNFYKMSEPSGLVDWVNTFRESNAYEKYNPHITLGHGKVALSFEYPIKFVPASVGLFHLGVHGTCKKELFRFELK